MSDNKETRAPCDCISRIAERVRESVLAKHPLARNIGPYLSPGYKTLFNVDTGAKREAMCFDVKGNYWLPKAKGDGTKKMAINTYVIASFCPFCGTKLTEGA